MVESERQQAVPARRSVEVGALPDLRTEHRARSTSESRNGSASRFSWVRRLMNNSKTSTGAPRPMRASLDTSQRVVPPPVRARSVSTGGTPLGALTPASMASSSSVVASSLDNASTNPLVSMSSVSVTSQDDDDDDVNDMRSNPSTTATSIAPTTAGASMSNNPGIITFNNYYSTTPSIAPSNPTTQQLDNSSVITLASSTRNRRRRSIDTNASTLGIPPASLYERMATPLHAQSIHTSIRQQTIDDSHDHVDSSSLVASDGMSNDITSIRSIKSYKSAWTTKTE